MIDLTEGREQWLESSEQDYMEREDYHWIKDSATGNISNTNTAVI